MLSHVHVVERTLGRCDFVARFVGAVIVFHHGSLPGLHLQHLIAGHWDPSRGRVALAPYWCILINRVHLTSTHLEVFICRDEGGAVPIDRHTPSLRCPRAAVPDADMHPQGLELAVLEPSHFVFQVAEDPDHDIVHEEGNQVLAPPDLVAVKVCGGVEAQVGLFLATPLSAHEDVGVKQVGLSGAVSQELHVVLAMRVSLW